MMIVPSFEVVIHWLGQARVPHYMCDQCHGIHVVDIQSLEGVIESRIFVENEGIMFTSELEVRPAALLPLIAELGRLNMAYPTLKIFVDVSDDALPRLMICDAIQTQAGLSFEQFELFINTAIACIKLLYAECEQGGYLILPEPNSAGQGAGAGAVH